MMKRISCNCGGSAEYDSDMKCWRCTSCWKENYDLCECGHLKSDHNHQEGCLGCPCRKGLIETKTIKGFVAMNEGEFDLQNISFCNNVKEAEQWKGQKILPVEVKFILGKVE